MNTVDALNVLGKALCGDSFEVKPGLTDAETILEIAKNYEGGGSSGSESKRIVELHFDVSLAAEVGQTDTGLTPTDLADLTIVKDGGECVVPLKVVPRSGGTQYTIYVCAGPDSGNNTTYGIIDTVVYDATTGLVTYS